MEFKEERSARKAIKEYDGKPLMAHPKAQNLMARLCPFSLPTDQSTRVSPSVSSEDLLREATADLRTEGTRGTTTKARAETTTSADSTTK